MNTLKIECSKDDYIIRTCIANSENEIKVELPEDWNCDYVNAVLWEDDICEIFGNDDERILMIPKCGELLLERLQEDEYMKHICLPVKYQDQMILIVKI